MTTKYCYEAYAQEGVQAFTFQEIDGMEKVLLTEKAG